MSKSLEKRSGSSFLDKVRERIIESYTPEKIEKKVGEMWDAKDVKMSKDGETYETPNWKAQDAALKTVLQLYGLENQDNNQRPAPTKITVIVNGTTAVVKDEKVLEAQVVEEVKPDLQT